MHILILFEAKKKKNVKPLCQQMEVMSQKHKYTELELYHHLFDNLTRNFFKHFGATYCP